MRPNNTKMPEFETEKGLWAITTKWSWWGLWSHAGHISTLAQPVPWPKAGWAGGPREKAKISLLPHSPPEGKCSTDCWVNGLPKGLTACLWVGPTVAPTNEWLSRTTNSPSLIVDCLREQLTIADQWLRRTGPLVTVDLVTGWGVGARRG